MSGLQAGFIWGIGATTAAIIVIVIAHVVFHIHVL